MSILIKGMDMPKSCWLCPLSVLYEKPREMLLCRIIKEEVLRNKIDGNCPLVEIPPHGRLIDADALEDRCSRQARNEWNKSTGTNWGYAYATFESDVEDAPTIIEAEEGE